MNVVGPEAIRRSVSRAAAIAAMREAVLAQARGELDTPMPMHLDLASGGGGEVHIKSSYRRGGPRFALKTAGTYARRPYGSIARYITQSVPPRYMPLPRLAKNPATSTAGVVV